MTDRDTSLEPIPVTVDPDLADLVPTYLERRRADVTDLRKAVAGRDAATAQTLGHRMKGTGASYGFAEITTTGARIEEAAKNEDFTEVASATDELESLLGRYRIVDT